MRKLKKKWLSFLLVMMIIAANVMVLPEDTGRVYAASDNQTMQLNDTFFDGTIAQVKEVDCYNFTIAAPGWVTITYQGWNISYGQYAIYSYDQTKWYAGEKVYNSSDTSPKTGSTTIALEAGTYIVKVWGGQYWDSICLRDYTGDYKLKGSYRAVNNNETEPNNSFQSAMPMGENSLVTGFFTITDQIDFYSFNLAAPATVDVTLTSSVYDMYFSVWNKDFIQVDGQRVYDASEASPKTATMQFNLEPGTYYIKCNPDSGLGGLYQIKWAYAPTLVTSVSIGGNKTVTAGSKLQLSASVMPSNASNRELAWTSSDTSVATVNAKTGMVSAKAAGSTVITAAAVDGSGVKASITVIVSPKQMAKPKVKSLGKKKVKVSWSKQKGTSEYQIQYATKKTFKKAKTLSAYNNKMTVVLKKKGTYYFRIRSVSQVNGAVLKGKWSQSVKIKVK